VHLRASARAEPLVERYRALVELGRVLTGIVRPDDLYHALAGRIGRALDAESFIVSRYEKDGDLASIVFVAGSPTPAGPTSYAGRECLAIREGRPVAHLPGDRAAAAAALSLDQRMRPALVAPILREGRTVGTLTAIGPAPAVYDADDLEFLAAAANLIAARSEPGRTGASAPNHRLDEIARAIRAISVPEALEHITRAIADAANGAIVTTWLVRSGGDLEAANTVGAGAPRKGTIVPLSHTLFRGLAERKDAVIVATGTESPDELAVFRPLQTGRTTLIWPLAADSRVLGAIAIGWTGESDAERADHGAIGRLAALASVAVAHGRLHEQIHALSLIDPLTGLANRRHLAMFLEKEFAAARRGRRLTILLLDIDGFADYNRTAGREAGDAALMACAEVITTHTRAMNLAARYGGDEFVVALADADRRAGFIHASRIAKAMANHPLIASISLRMSVGIASFSPRMASLDDLIRAAFNDLEARRKGGGRLTI